MTWDCNDKHMLRVMKPYHERPVEDEQTAPPSTDMCHAGWKAGIGSQSKVKVNLDTLSVDYLKVHVHRYRVAQGIGLGSGLLVYGLSVVHLNTRRSSKKWGADVRLCNGGDGQLRSLTTPNRAAMLCTNSLA